MLALSNQRTLVREGGSLLSSSHRVGLKVRSAGAGREWTLWGHNGVHVAVRRRCGTLASSLPASARRGLGRRMRAGLGPTHNPEPFSSSFAVASGTL